VDFGVAVFSCPQIEWNCCQFVDQRVGEAVFREVHGLDVDLTSVAALDPHVRELLRGRHRKSGLVFLSASGTDNAAEFPFTKTETADQAAAGAVALRAQDGDGGLAMAERA
jgi:hypothetical protein